MNAAYIAIDLPAWMIAVAVIGVVGAALLTVLMILRAVVHRGAARIFALVVLALLLLAFPAPWMVLAPPGAEDSVEPLAIYCIVVISLVAVFWGLSLWVATRYRLWTDALVLGIPLTLGAVIWANG